MKTPAPCARRLFLGTRHAACRPWLPAKRRRRGDEKGFWNAYTLIVKRPSLFVDVTDLPGDLGATVEALRRNEVPGDFRALPGRSLYQWLPRVGHKGKVPSRLKAFRFGADDAKLLSDLQQRLDMSQVDVLRRALRELHRATVGDKAGIDGAE